MKEKTKFITLTPTEELIYSTLSKNTNGSSVSHISKDIKLARTSVYSGISKLIKKNLIKNEGYKYFLCKNDLQKYKPKIQNTSQLINMCLEKISSLNKGEVVYSIESDGEIEALFKEREKFLNWQKQVIKRGIILKGIGSKNSLQLFRSKLTKNLSEVLKKRSGSARFTDVPINGPCTLITFRDNVFFISKTKDFYFELNNKYVAQFIRSLFEIFDETLKYQAIID